MAVPRCVSDWPPQVTPVQADGDPPPFPTQTSRNLLLPVFAENEASVNELALTALLVCPALL